MLDSFLIVEKQGSMREIFFSITQELCCVMGDILEWRI